MENGIALFVPATRRTTLWQWADEPYGSLSDAHGSPWQIERLLRNGRKIPAAARITRAFSHRGNADTRYTPGTSPKFCIVRTDAARQHPVGHRKGMQS